MLVHNALCLRVAIAFPATFLSSTLSLTVLFIDGSELEEMIAFIMGMCTTFRAASTL